MEYPRKMVGALAALLGLSLVATNSDIVVQECEKLVWNSVKDHQSLFWFLEVMEEGLEAKYIKGVQAYPAVSIDYATAFGSAFFQCTVEARVCRHSLADDASQISLRDYLISEIVPAQCSSHNPSKIPH